MPPFVVESATGMAPWGDFSEGEGAAGEAFGAAPGAGAGEGAAAGALDFSSEGAPPGGLPPGVPAASGEAEGLPAGIGAAPNVSLAIAARSPRVARSVTLPPSRTTITEIVSPGLWSCSA
jgi:hypothetical protein